MDELLRQVVSESCLAKLPADALSLLLADALRIDAPAGAVIAPPDDVPRVGIVASGLIRVFRIVPDGRTVTNRYVGRGGIAGIPTLFASPIAAQVHALTASTIYQFPASVWRQAARNDARIACAFLEIVSELLMTLARQSTTDVLGSVRQRVVRQLLDIAAERQQGAELVAPVTQQQLADGIGSAREVVARVLRGLREKGLVTTGVGGVVLLDPIRLQAELSSVA